MSNVYYVYILETLSKNGRTMYYTGYTNDLYRRLDEHRNDRGAQFTKGREIQLRYFESFTDRKEAMHRELEIKSFSREEKENLIKRFQKS
jgi:putative endonuclease